MLDSTVIFLLLNIDQEQTNNLMHHQQIPPFCIKSYLLRAESGFNNWPVQAEMNA